MGFQIPDVRIEERSLFGRRAFGQSPQSLSPRPKAQEGAPLYGEPPCLPSEIPDRTARHYEAESFFPASVLYILYRRLTSS